MGKRIEAFFMNGGHSLKKRYIFKLLSGLIGIPLNFIIQMIAPRGLGPKFYGDYNFLMNFFNQFMGFFESGTLMGFFTKLSQRPKEKKLVSFYSYFLLFVISLTAIFIFFLLISGTYKGLLPGQEPFYIILALFCGAAALPANVAGQMADAYGLTVSCEKIKILQKTIAAALIISIFFIGKLNLLNYFVYSLAMFLLLFVLCGWAIERKGHSSISLVRMSASDLKGYAQEFYKYCHPLFIFSLVGMVCAIFERWLLQFYGGSVEQGFFSLSYNIGAVCFLFTGAMTPLIMREFSIAYDLKDFDQMAGLFHRYIPLFYLITAFFGAFVAFNADKISLIIGGSGFKGAGVAVAVMAFFPMHQTYGQLSGSFFYATGQTRIYRNIGVIFMLAGLPLTYLFIAPREIFGMGLGAAGLAVKTVLIQFVAVNVQLYFNTRFLKLSFWSYLRHQIVTLACLLCIAGAATLFAGRFPFIGGNMILSLSAAGFLYTLIVLLVMYCLPALFGVKREDFQFVMAWLKNR